MRNLVALLCAALLATAAVAAEPPVVENRAATPAQPKLEAPAEEVVVTSKRPQLEVPAAVLAPVVHIAPPTPCIEIGTKRCTT
jgi:hypothetical protein